MFLLCLYADKATLFPMFIIVLFIWSTFFFQTAEGDKFFANFPDALINLLVLLTTANNPDGKRGEYPECLGFFPAGEKKLALAVVDVTFHSLTYQQGFTILNPDIIVHRCGDTDSSTKK